MPNLTPVIGIVAAHRNMGKTTLLEKLIHLLQHKGLRVCVIKHTHHDIEIDRPGKDSYRFREAGAGQVLISSNRRWALITETDSTSEPSLESLIEKLHHSNPDIILFEGFKNADFPKIEVYRASTADMLYPGDRNIVAIATDDTSLCADAGLPVFDLDAVDEITGFVLHRFNLG